jgi:hypothetical protein
MASAPGASLNRSIDILIPPMLAGSSKTGAGTYQSHQRRIMERRQIILAEPPVVPFPAPLLRPSVVPAAWVVCVSGGHPALAGPGAGEPCWLQLRRVLGRRPGSWRCPGQDRRGGGLIRRVKFRRMGRDGGGGCTHAHDCATAGAPRTIMERLCPHTSSRWLGGWGQQHPQLTLHATGREPPDGGCGDWELAGQVQPVARLAAAPYQSQEVAAQGKARQGVGLVKHSTRLKTTRQ